MRAVSLFDDFISLIWPRTCMACGKALYRYEDSICTNCNLTLPQTNFHTMSDNPVSRLFWGRVKLESAASFYYFSKGSRVQHMMHSLKYRGNKDIGILLGRLYGNELINAPLFNSVNCIIPVPLHPKRLRFRGYNQSEMISIGLSAGMRIPVDTTTLLRNTATTTQTRKTRFKRWENVSEVFVLNNPEKIENMHILLVDDVVTTGSTIEACAHTLLSAKNTKISLATIACAVK